MDESLVERRRRLEAVRSDDADMDAVLAREVRDSWRRCALLLGEHDRRAPVDEDDVDDAWDESPIRRAEAGVLEQLAAAAEDGDMVAAVTDAEGIILWSHGGRTMRRRAESVNFVRGGRWAEEDAGTNAVAMAITSGRPSTVFSAEHWSDDVTDWVCYSAPVRDPVTGDTLGLIDLSATWDRATPLGLPTVTTMARLVEAQLTAEIGAPVPVLGRRTSWELFLTGRGELRRGSAPVALSGRQVEVLAVISLCDGVTLDELHAHVYGDRPVAMSTLKAELSHLRKRIGAMIESRPYRVAEPVRIDVDDILAAIDHGRVSEALDHYRGPVLPRSESPFVQARGHHLDVALRDAVLAHGSVSDRRRYSVHHPDDVELLLGR